MSNQQYIDSERELLSRARSAMMDSEDSPFECCISNEMSSEEKRTRLHAARQRAKSIVAITEQLECLEQQHERSMSAISSELKALKSSSRYNMAADLRELDRVFSSFEENEYPDFNKMALA